MAKIYFNRPIIKHVEETTVINFFFQKDGGESLYVRDTRPDVYRDNKVIFGDIILERHLTEPDTWNCDIVKMKNRDYSVFGFFVGEGVEFEIITARDPVFRIRQKETEMSLATVAYMPQGGEVPEVTLGLFHLGTKIKYRRNGVQVLDELTKHGWVRKMGPSDYKFGIITIEDAFKKKLLHEEKMKDPVFVKETLLNDLEKIRDAKRKHDIHPELADSLLKYKNDDNEDTTYYFLASDVKDLVKKDIIL